jgi:Homeodomain-like domain
MGGRLTNAKSVGSKARVQTMTDSHWKAIELRAAGASYREIGAALGVTHVTARNWVLTAVDEVKYEQAETMRKVEGTSLDRLQRAMWPEAIQGDAKAAMAVLRIMERRARLFGLDAPVKVDAQVTEVTQADMEMAELVREAKAKAATQDA